jgi:hypothetical protein
MFDENPQKPQEYNFASGGISDFLEDFNTPKQSKDINEDFSELESIEYEKSEKILPDKLQTSASVAKTSASILTIALDSALSSVFAFIANESPEDFKADDDQREELQKAFTEYTKLKGGEIPPGLMLIILVISIYAGKGITAVQLRKANKRNEQLEAENARLRALHENEQ